MISDWNRKEAILDGCTPVAFGVQIRPRKPLSTSPTLRHPDGLAMNTTPSSPLANSLATEICSSEFPSNLYYLRNCQNH